MIDMCPSPPPYDTLGVSSLRMKAASSLRLLLSVCLLLEHHVCHELQVHQQISTDMGQSSCFQHESGAQGVSVYITSPFFPPAAEFVWEEVRVNNGCIHPLSSKAMQKQGL